MFDGISSFIANGLIAGSIYSIIALGFSVIYRTVKFFHLAHGAVYAVGAYVAYSLVVGLNWNPIVSFFFATAAAGIVGVVIDRIVYCPLRKRKATNLVFLLASFGIFIFIQNLIQLLYGAQILSLRTGPVNVGHRVLGAVITNNQILIIAVSLVLLISLWFFIKKTKIGKAMRAVADDPMAARTVGLNSERIIMYAFALGSVLAGAAGVLIALETNLEPTMGLNAMIKGLIAAIIGGIGNIPGVVLGGLFLGVIENLGIWKISAGWKDAIAFAVLIIFLLFRPEGILGSKFRKDQV